MERKRKETKWEDMRISRIKCIGGYTLRYQFVTGIVMEYDIEKHARKNPELFKKMLDNPEIVKEVQLYSPYHVEWDDLMDFESDYLYCVGTIVKEY